MSTDAQPVTTPAPATSPPVAPSATPAGPTSGTTTLGAAPPPPAPSATPPSETPPPAAADFDLKVPEGIQADEALKEFKTLAKEAGLKPEAAQKTVDLFAKATQASEARRAAELERLQTGWVESLKADKEVGGADFDQNAQVARKAIAKFGTPELRAFFESTGLGNHPEFVRFAYRIGKALGEDTVAGTATNGHATAANNDEAFHRAMYPTMNSKEQA